MKLNYEFKLQHLLLCEIFMLENVYLTYSKTFIFFVTLKLLTLLLFCNRYYMSIKTSELFTN